MDLEALEYGFNPTPVWVAIGSPLAQHVPAGSSSGLLLLSLADFLLLALLFCAIGQAFGLDASLYALTFFPLVFVAGFGWVGGAFLRYLWLAALVWGIWALRRRRGLLAGLLFALAASLRVFPALLILPLVFKVLYRRFSADRSNHHQGLLAGLAIGGLSLFLLSGLLPCGFEHWSEFRVNMQNQVHTVSSNFVGLTEVFEVGRQEAHGFDAPGEHSTIRRLQWWVLLPSLLLFTFWVARWQTDLGALALGIPIVFTAISLAAYYWVVLLVLLLLWRRIPNRLALLFAFEAGTFLLYFFVENESLLYSYRSSREPHRRRPYLAGRSAAAESTSRPSQGLSLRRECRPPHGGPSDCRDRPTRGRSCLSTRCPRSLAARGASRDPVVGGRESARGFLAGR